MHPWEKLREDVVYRGWRSLLRRRFRLPDGRTADFDIIDAKHYVTVAALTEAGEFLLTRQFRPGPEDFLLSFAEGGIDPGEDPREAARRELREETGFLPGQLQLLRTFRSSYTNQRQYCFLATGCRPDGEQQLDPHEFIELLRMPPAELRALLRQAEDAFVNVGCAYMALADLDLL